MKDLMKQTWFKAVMGVLAFILAILLMRGCNAIRKHNASNTSTSQTSSSSSRREQTDYEREQGRLIKRYGDPGKGYRWSDEGTRMALGDPNLSESEVAATFIRSLSTLDFATAQKYAFKDDVIKTVNNYYSNDADFTYDESFKKAMYQQVLLSLEPVKTVSTATFADARSNITLQVKLLDLSNKDFWEKDKDEIFSNLDKYRKNEQDTTKARNFVYDYVLSYWKSEDAQKKTVQINLTLTQTNEGGWLVSNDTDLDNYAKYTDGETVVNNILQAYEDNK